MNVLKRAAVRLLRPRGTHHNRWAGRLFDWFEGTYRAGGCTFEIPRDLTTQAFRARFFFRVYEPEEVALVQQHVRPDDTVLEVGGGIGVIACVTNRQLAHPERHVVVEAHPRLVPWLRRNRDRNGCAFRVEHGLLGTGQGTAEAAEAGEDGGGQARVRDGHAAFFVHPLIVGGSAQRETAEQVMVPLCSLEALAEEAGADFSTLILDIEGGEKHFLEAHGDALAKARMVIVEFHAHIGILTEEEAEAGRERLREAGLTLAESRNHVEVWKRR